MRTLILNSNDIVDGTNNSLLQYNFIGGNVILKKGQKVALASLQMYYSTFNITAALNNNVFNYVWVDGTVNQVLFPDGFYDIVAINNYLHFIMLQNTHYLVDTAGDYVWFISFAANPVRYAIEVNCFPMSVAIAAANTWVLPVAATWVIPNNIIVPMLQVLTNNFRNIIGFQSGFYPQGAPTYAIAVIAGVIPNQTQTPAYTVAQSFLSTVAPQITPFSSFLLNCSLVNNNYAVPNSLIYSFSPQGQFGSQFTIAPNEYVFIDVNEGIYASFNVFFTDQNNFPISILDPNMIIQILISDPSDKG